MGNKRYLSKKITKSTFICDRAITKEWDMFAFTGGFSPRNESFTYFYYFVLILFNLVCDYIRYYRECLTRGDIYIYIYIYIYIIDSSNIDLN